MSWFLLSLLAGVCFAGARVVARIALRKQGNAMAFTAVHDVIAGLVLLPFFLLPFSLPSHNMTWLYFFGIVIFAFLSDWLAFAALKILDVSVYQIVNQVRHVFILLGGLLLFQEDITAKKIVAIVLITSGVVTAVYEKKRFHWNRGVMLTIASTLAAVIAFLFAKLTVRDFSEIATASFELLLIGLMSFMFLRFDTKKIIAEFSLHRGWLILSGALFAGFEATLFFALKAGEASRVIPVTQSSLVFAVLTGMIFLHERDRLLNKILGMLIAIAGIVLLYF